MPIMLEVPKLSDLNLKGKILLINSPVYDSRISWANWQQPLGLLQIGTTLKSQGCDVRLIDSLQTNINRLARTKTGEKIIDGYKIDIWQFGISPKNIRQVLSSWINDSWLPDAILVSCNLSSWWQGANATIREIKTITSAPVLLGGHYPSAYPDHALENTIADVIVVGNIHSLGYVPTDFDIFSPLPKPRFAAIQIYESNQFGKLIARPLDLVIEELKQKCDLGINSYILYDEYLHPEQKENLSNFLEMYIASDINVQGSRNKPKMIAPGNFSPRLIDKNFAKLLMKARFSFISLHDDLIHKPNLRMDLSSYDDYQNCVDALITAGMKPRTGEVDASVVIGIPGENIREITIRMAQLSSIVGAIHLVPFQYSPISPEGASYSEWLERYNGHQDITNLNGKLFPLARMSGINIENYWELTRLMALLNSKFHSKTHDFLGNNYVSNLVRKSLKSDLWNPFKGVEEETTEVIL